MIRVTRSENQLGSESDDEPELQVLDSGRHKAALSPHLGKQRKRRLKFFVVFHGDRASRRLRIQYASNARAMTPGVTACSFLCPRRRTLLFLVCGSDP